MTQRPTFSPTGVIPACLLPFRKDLSMDVEALRRHLLDIAAVGGLSGLTVNGHASEVSSCSADEQARVLEIAGETVGDRLPLVAGIYADGSLEAAALARRAERAGASALLVFPPSLFNKGVQSRGEMALAHFGRIADATDLPIIAFQYAMSSGMGYRLETLLALAECVPSVVAIKDNSSDPAFHDQTIRALHGAPRPLKVLTTHSSWLLSSLVLGCDGILSGSGSVVAALQVALWEAVRDGDLKRAQAAADRIYPWTQAVYAAPPVDAHGRMKAALVLMGRLGCATVRPPLVELPGAEVDRIARTLRAGGLLAAA